ncbi:hypothetical protein QE152_g18148 [Popillia japonica]|uniref:Uncharacterized protein n=1 Tax=Popillia japonica TaxID=7064 RepID=A0AAW1L577_POPJA
MGGKHANAWPIWAESMHRLSSTDRPYRKPACIDCQVTDRPSLIYRKPVKVFGNIIRRSHQVSNLLLMRISKIFLGTFRREIGRKLVDASLGDLPGFSIGMSRMFFQELGTIPVSKIEL